MAGLASLWPHESHGPLVVCALRQHAAVGQALAQQHILAVGHLGREVWTRSFFWREPHDVERVLAWLAVAIHGHHVRERDGVLARIKVRRDALGGKVLGYRERRWGSGNSRQRDRP